MITTTKATSATTAISATTTIAQSNPRTTLTIPATTKATTTLDSKR